MSFRKEPLNLLIVEDNEGDYVLFETYLHLTDLDIKKCHHAKALSEITVSEGEIDIAFLDLSLPDSGGIESFLFLNQYMPNVPIVILSGLADEKVALDCIARGAQDYLLKNELDERLLEKSINYSIERKKNLEEVLAINRQYELIGDITNDVIWKWDIQQQKIFYGKKSFLGYKAEEIENTPDWWMDKIHPEDKQRFIQNIAGILHGKTVQMQMEYRFRTSNGTYEHLYSRGVLLSAKDGAARQIVGAIMNVTESKRLQEDLVNAQLNFQRQLTEAMILGQEKQKEEIGKELHDNINQILASVNLYLDIAMKNDSMRDELLGKSKENIIFAINEIRKLSHSLIPPSLGSYGLVDAIKGLIDEIMMLELFRITLSVDGYDETAIDGNRKLMLYRIVQEQVNNIVKYAKAQEVRLILKMTLSTLRLFICDDGIGFDMSAKSKGIGLKNIESRVSYYNGEVKLNSAPGKGTTLEVCIPI